MWTLEARSTGRGVRVRSGADVRMSERMAERGRGWHVASLAGNYRLWLGKWKRCFFLFSFFLEVSQKSVHKYGCHLSCIQFRMCLRSAFWFREKGFQQRMASMSGKRFAQSATLCFNVNHYKIRLFLQTNFEKIRHVHSILYALLPITHTCMHPTYAAPPEQPA